MTIRPDSPLPPRAPTRRDIELMIAVAWNDDGAKRGLLPLAWRLGSDEFLHFAGSAEAYAHGRRQEIIEEWIAALGLVDDIDPLSPPLHQRAQDMIWTADIDGIGVGVGVGVGVEFSYPATVGP
jgi:hypothetical protein